MTGSPVTQPEPMPPHMEAFMVLDQVEQLLDTSEREFNKISLQSGWIAIGSGVLFLLLALTSLGRWAPYFQLVMGLTWLGHGLSVFWHVRKRLRKQRGGLPS